MFSHLAAFTVLAAPLLAAATPAPGAVARGEPASSCSTAPIQCCESTTSAGSATGAALLKGLGIVVQDVDALLGLTCSPISVVGVGSGSACSTTAVCCEDNSHGGLVSIGCVPVTL
ncbi:fungal hydrophobin [Panus rudis PR-1116 ss-1]|nr:fungal hydrophobin [Panus rudis PR-1116 ss-1]